MVIGNGCGGGWLRGEVNRVRSVLGDAEEKVEYKKCVGNELMGRVGGQFVDRSSDIGGRRSEDRPNDI